MAIRSDSRLRPATMVVIALLGPLAAGSLATAQAASYTLAKTLLKPTPPPRLGDQFGRAVATVGTNVVVGAPLAGNTGAAYLFGADPASPSFGTLLHTFAKPTPVTGDQFGSALAVLGQTILIGDLSDDTGASNAGAVYLFDADPASPSFGTLLRPLANPTAAADDQFGAAIAVAGTNVLVGARFDDTAAENAGAVYLFDATTGALLKSFQSPAPAAGDLFGSAVAQVGTKALIGSPDDDAQGTNAGAAYLFDGDPASPTFGALQHTFQSPEPASTIEFGTKIAALGRNVLIGALDTGGTANHGVIYLFDADPLSPTFGGLLHTFHPPEPAEFGFVMAAQGANVLIGTPRSGGPGAAYLFDGDPASPTFGGLLHPFVNPTPVGGDLFGFALTAVGTNVLVADPFDDSQAGAAYLFDLCGNGVATAGEQCDTGDRLGTDCCAPTCELAPAGSACPDDDPCTDDVCDAAGTCVHTANAAACDDGDACTDGDACSGGQCVPGSPRDCDDTNACTDDACDPATGCVNTPNADPCNDADDCTTGDTCRDGACAGGPPRDCRDADPCTADGCDPDRGCTHVSVPACEIVLPVFTASTRGCQAAVESRARHFAGTTQRLLQKCLDRVLDEAAGHAARPSAVDACANALDPAVPSSAFARAKARALARIGKKCAGTTPAALNSPCNDAATTIGEVAACILDHHTVRVQQMIAAESRDACALLSAVGLKDAFPVVCAGP